jgi:hypothetical protein
MISIDILYGWGIEHEWSCQDCAASCPKGYYGQGEHIIGDLANPRLHFCQLTLMRCLAYYNMLHVFACADLLKEIPARSVRKTVKSVMVSSCVHTLVCKPHLCKFPPSVGRTVNSTRKKEAFLRLQNGFSNQIISNLSMDNCLHLHLHHL